MTTDDRSPHARTHDEAVDLWASRLLDGDVSSHQVPEDLRDEVGARVRVFTELRIRLLQSPANVPADDRIRDEQIAHAVSTSIVSARASRSLVSRTAFGIAASFVLIAGVATIVVRGSGSGGDVMVADSTDVSENAQESAMAFALDSTSSESGSAPAEPEPKSSITDVTPSASADLEGPTALPRFATVDELAVFAAELDPRQPITEGLNRRRIDTCQVKPAQAPLVEEALVMERRVQIQVFEPGVFVVVDSETCAIIVDRVPTR